MQLQALAASGAAMFLLTPISVGVAAETTSGGGGATVEATTNANTDDSTTTVRTSAADRGGEPSQTPWIRRFTPVRNEVELGAYGGALLPSPEHELYQEDPLQPEGGFSGFSTAAGTMGGRVGFVPLRFMGLEVEGGASPTRTVADARATVWHVRGSLVGQIPRWSVVPFALLGAGALGVSSSDTGLGDDTDAAIHFGAGLKINASERMQVRLDLRDTVAARRGADNGVAHNGEILLGAAVRLGRRPEAPPPVAKGPGDRDLDGFVDPVDACPDRAGVEPDGCPVRDSDADGFLDPDDRCPDVAGVEPDGCPVLDRDRDGFLDDVDACPEQPGVDPDGCPLRDRDGDGLFDRDDACPDEAEVRNGFEDADGCPDEIPDEIKAFTGVIDGIYFDVNKATIRSRSRSVLERAVSVLGRYPSIMVEISGHTDTTGPYAHNVELSGQRADAVRRYLVDAGIGADRITTRGAGPDEPISNNSSKRGRERNRRIEFRVVER